MNIRKNTKIVLFLPNLGGGGAERVMLHLAQGLRKKGWSASLLVFRAMGPYLKYVEENGLLLHNLNTKPRYGLPSLLRFLRENKPDLLISALESANVMAIAAGRLLHHSVRPKVIVTDHNTPSVYYSSFSLLKKPHLRLFPLWGGWLYRQADRFVSVSEGARKDAVRIYKLDPSKTKTIYNPVVTPNLFRLASGEVKHPFLSLKNVKVIVGIGRLTAQKDFATLIRAFKKVVSSTPSRLIILGEGPDREKLIRLAHQLRLEGLVDMPGFVDNPYAYLAKSDLFVLSSRFEGFGNVLVEALAVGTPVVSTDCPHGPREILEGGKWGLLAPVGDANALARAMLKQLKQPVLPSKQAWQRFTTEAVVEQWEELLSHIF